MSGNSNIEQQAFMRKNLAKNPHNQIQQQTIKLGVQQTHSISFFPPAEELERLRNIDPDFPKVVMGLIEKQSLHRIEQEKKVLAHKIEQENVLSKNATKGQVFAFVLSICVMVLAYCFMSNGFATQGATFMTTTIVGLASAFLWANYKQKSNQQK